MQEHKTPGTGVVPTLPPRVPRVPENRFTRGVGRAVLRLGGWKVAGEFPDLPRAVLIGAPHTSNWDGVWGFAAKLALGLDMRILGKDSLFRVPVVGWLVRALGVIPVDRSAAHGVVDQAVAMIRQSDRLWFGLAPEGTRKPVERWKTGFWKIAHGAGVPIVPVYFHYRDRRIVVAPPIHTGEDMDGEIAAIRHWYRQVSRGRNRDA
ncbi:lysophospholipid acyltransferase family protein [Lysobacter sp. GX 14042]|uniref:lysophospholipid acyltransferase family protein n=1 Tax=Lysobacter sp. GX 14042 TaxID=2907155 RepID=UPI001F2A5D9A|nr:lysophospholipid acyltransferase family protein [Lysobacter sp. GX 14042]MCE7032243.1 lysophospholipid acyltransferase family protein [Lysobacter sp. GX 14042]